MPKLYTVQLARLEIVSEDLLEEMLVLYNSIANGRYSGGYPILAYDAAHEVVFSCQIPNPDYLQPTKEEWELSQLSKDFSKDQEFYNFQRAAAADVPLGSYFECFDSARALRTYLGELQEVILDLEKRHNGLSGVVPMAKDLVAMYHRKIMKTLRNDPNYYKFLT